MPEPDSFRCMVIGEGTLPIRCGEILRQLGHEIIGVISSDPAIANWAKQGRLPHFESWPGPASRPGVARFDYLFSIVNPQILPPDVLDLAQRGAINYHDALLPRYAGTYATSWALINQEPYHGVTWHLMGRQVDAGDLLVQRKVVIVPGETAVTLNVKCYEAAVASFHELVTGLSSTGHLLPRPQNAGQRTFYGRCKKPSPGCLISWNRGAAEIDAMVRALHFGAYANGLGLAKFMVKGTFFVLPKVEEFHPTSHHAPGTITRIDREAIRVATATHEVAFGYVSTLEGRPLPLPEFVAQCRLREGDCLDEVTTPMAACLAALEAAVCPHERFWVQKLAASKLVRFPAEAKVPPETGGVGPAKTKVSIPPGVWKGAAAGGCTAAEFLLAAFVIYLARSGRLLEFSIGFSEMELRQKVVGWEGIFSARVPLCFEVNPLHTFAEACEMVRTELGLVRRHMTYARDIVSRQPILASRLEDGCSWPVSVDWVERWEDSPIPGGGEVTLAVALGLEECRLVYDAGRFDEPEIATRLSQFTTLLDGILADPDRCIGDLPLQTEAERHQVLVEWNNTATDYPRERCIHELFEAQADRTPDAVAAECDGVRATYQEIDHRANRLAADLQSLGVGPDVPVALAVQRSIAMLVGMLAILKAGGAYVPINLAYPKERVRFVLDDTRAPVLVTQRPLLDRFAWFDGRVHCLEASEESNIRTAIAPNRTNAGHLAYIMYTSGSTGDAKGVAIPHRGVVRLVRGTNYAELTSAEVFFQLAPAAFDAATFEIWGSLLNGARLVVCPAGTPTLEELAQAIEGHRITTLFLTTGLFHELVDQYLENFQFVTQMLTGGDVLSPAHAQRFLEAHPGCRLINVYGPTENTSFTCFHVMSSPEVNRVSVPIGRPVANTRVYLLDKLKNPVPVGVEAELYAGGDGLARGYWGRPDLTREQFLPDPFSDDPEARLYRTGDLARYRPGGTIEFLGRIDRQVKIRGFRIEPAELEAALRRHPGVRDAVVTVQGEDGREKRMAAYVAGDPATLSARELREYLASTLPDYLLPSALMILDKFPLTPNGKLDRCALPEAQPLDAFIQPRTSLENEVAVIWEAVLGVPRIGRDDNFFDRGGHSLLALRMVNRLKDLTRKRVPLALVFRAPTLRLFAEALQRDYADGASQAAHTGSAAPSPNPKMVPRYPRSEAAPDGWVLPTSFAQRQLWLLDQLRPGHATYNVPLAWRVTGDLNAPALQRALEALVGRHEILRTTFRARPDGEPVQVVAPVVRVPLAMFDLRGPVPEEVALRTDERIAALAWAPFNLATGPLLRPALLQIAEQRHVLVLTFHHIVFDEWSRQILTRELLTLYEALVQGREPHLPDLPIQYADHAQWQREEVDGCRREAELRFWRDRLAGLPVLQLPMNRPRPRYDAAAAANANVSVPPALADALRTLARSEDATLFATVLTAFKVLLARYSGQDDFAVGSPIAARGSSEAESLIGYFLNMLVLRTRLDGNLTFREALRRVRNGTLEAFEHQDLPFDLVVEALAPERIPGLNPLFQVAFVLVGAQAACHAVPGLQFEPFEVEDQTAKFDLTLSLVEHPDGLRGTFTYNPALFDNEMIKSLSRHFGTLLEAIVAEPDARVSELPLLNPTEREQLIVAWNATRSPFPNDATISRVFERQVAQAPKAIALEHGGIRWTYDELNRRANRLAHELQAKGMGTGQLVAVCLPRSAPMVAALLAVLKAGNAYVPIDPAYPPARRSRMLNGVSMVVTDRQLAREFPDHADRLICVDVAPAGLGSEENLGPCAEAGSLAYVVYTSGSTGAPKGVAVPHRAVNRLVLNTNYIALDGSDVVGQTSNTCFDAATFEIWGALLNGAQLVILDQDVILAPGRLAQELRRYGITTLWLTTPLFNLIAQHAPGAFSGLRTVLFGGETADVRRVAAVLAQGGPQRLINAYGPTETTTFAACYEVHSLAGDALTIPIGRPISNTTLYVLDQWQKPVPIGVRGEIHVGGPGLARGYLDDPELTAKRFVPDPFSAEPDARLYRTGDFGRWRPDGTVEFLGRMDQQLKIRGFRVEPGEIEATLKQHRAVRNAAVTAHGPGVEGEKRLVAYVVADPAELTVRELREFFTSTLPDYMVPSAVVTVEKIPLTAHGKVDWRALPDPACAFNEPASAPPRNRWEGQLAAIWAKALNVPRVGLTDDFFAQGGTSLTAVRLFADINQVFGTNLPVSALLQNPTVEKLARKLEASVDEKEQSPVVALQPQGARTPFFGIHAGLGNVLFYRELSRFLGNEQPFYGIQSEGLTGGPIARTSVEAMAEYYWEEIRKVQPRGPYLVGGYSFGGLVAYEMARQIQEAGDKVGLLVLFDTGNPARPPRLRSLTERIWHAARNPAAFAPDRILQFLSHRTRGRTGEKLLRWSERYRRAALRLRHGSGRAATEEATALRVVTAHQRAMLAYRPRPYKGDLTLLRAATPEEGYVVEPDLGWGSLASGEVAIHDVPGSHWTLFSPENVGMLARVLDAVLRRAQERASGPNGVSLDGKAGRQ
ncbi:MAG TPA: amino acid adenylation domain-containing protein [Chthoniobacterales bacterium]